MNREEDPIERELEALRAEVRDLKAVLRLNDAKLLITFRLPTKLNNLLGILLSQPIVTSEMIEKRLEIASEAKVTVHRLNKRLRPYGIKVQSGRGTGYWLTEEDKRKINRMIERAVTGEVMEADRSDDTDISPGEHYELTIPA